MKKKNYPQGKISGSHLHAIASTCMTKPKLAVSGSTVSGGLALRWMCVDDRRKRTPAESNQ